MQQGSRGGYDALLTWQERDLQYDARAWASINVNAARLSLHMAQCAYQDALAQHADEAKLAEHQAKILNLAARLKDMEEEAATQRSCRTA
jgi:hypothetical protein